MHSRFLVICLLTVAATIAANSSTIYVSLSGGNLSPFTNWVTAATDPQSAINAAADGDLILVTNGVYQTGGQVVYGAMTNRVAITKLLTVQSVNGPAGTIIQGSWDPNTTNGDSAVRCAYLTNGASLIGFTLTNGATRAAGDSTYEQSGGGVWCEDGSCLVSNCTLVANAASYYGGGGSGGTLYNCSITRNSAGSGGGGAWNSAITSSTLTGNTAYSGGGTISCSLTNCTLTGNTAHSGGGTFGGSLSNCTLTGNSAYNGGGAYSSVISKSTLRGNVASGSACGGGGAYTCTLNNCILTGNVASGSAGFGGGAYRCTLNSCILNTNSSTTDSSSSGGGAFQGTLNNCALTGNSSRWGGGAYGGATLNNCTLTKNTATYGGGTYSSTVNNCSLALNTATYGAAACYGSLNNCIIYFNGLYQNTVNYSCVEGGYSGTGNITNAPLFLDVTNGNLRLQSNSACINAGNNAGVSGTTDLDGNPRIAGEVVDLGAYEYPNPTSRISYAWLQRYGLATDGSADNADPDQDAMTTWQEWHCATNPTNAASVLRLTSPAYISTNVVVTWQSVSGITYFVQRSTNLAATPPFVTIASNLSGKVTSTSYTNLNAAKIKPIFYRVGVQ
jgi:hypothetical protein